MQMEAEFILFVQDQQRSRDFYAAILGQLPSLDVPGMSEFELGPSSKLGLMPANGIAKIITPSTPHPSAGQGIPRCELYLLVENAIEFCHRAMRAGALVVSELSPRDWGHRVAYFADWDGHILAIAERMGKE
jgi:lactoylglutathione lyase